MRKKRGFLQHRGKAERGFVILANIFAQWVHFSLVFTGIAVLSSLLFIGTVDAIVVVLRYHLSVLVCRLVLMFELSGMASVENDYQKLNGKLVQVL